MPAQCGKESEGLLRTAAICRPRRHGGSAHDHLQHAPDLADTNSRAGRAMIREQPITAVEKALHRRWRLLTPLYVLLALIAIIGIAGAVAGVILLWQLGQNRTPHYADIVEEFKYGSIGAEPHSG